MLTERKSAILKGVITRYVQTGAPVGSAVLVKEGALKASPATVRAEMAQLEAEGYLTHPHTSSGRVPTDRGYRYFVDYLIRPSFPSRYQREYVMRSLEKASPSTEAVLAKGVELLASLSSYGAVAIGGFVPFARIRAVELVDISPVRILLVVVLSSGDVERIEVDFDREVGAGELERARACVERYLVGTEVRGASQVKEKPEDLDEVSAKVLDSVAAALTSPRYEEVPLTHYLVDGFSNLAKCLSSAEVAALLMGSLREASTTTALLWSTLSKGSPFGIGAENGEVPWAECSVVVEPVSIENEPVALVGLIGPKRMNYERAIGLVSFVKGGIARSLSRV